MYTVGFTSVTFRDLSAREIAALADKTDMRHLEWGGDVHLPAGNAAAADEISILQENFNLRAESYGTYYRLGQKAFGLFEEICKTASAIGAPVIRIWQGNKGSAETDGKAFSDMVAETRRLSEIAAEYDKTIAFEFHKKTNNDSGQSALRFLQAVGRGNVKTYWQPFGDLAADTENLKAVLPYLDAVHVFCWDADGKRHALKRGKREWLSWMQILADSGKNMRYIMEFVKKDSPAQLRRDARVLREWLEAVYGRDMEEKR